MCVCVCVFGFFASTTKTPKQKAARQQGGLLRAYLGVPFMGVPLEKEKFLLLKNEHKMKRFLFLYLPKIENTTPRTGLQPLNAKIDCWV